MGGVPLFPPTQSSLVLDLQRALAGKLAPGAVMDNSFRALGSQTPCPNPRFSFSLRAFCFPELHPFWHREKCSQTDDDRFR